MTTYYITGSQSVFSILPSMVLDRTFYEGLILGLQESPVTTSECYEYFGSFADFVWSAQYAVLFDTYKANA